MEGNKAPFDRLRVIGRDPSILRVCSGQSFDLAQDQGEGTWIQDVLRGLGSAGAENGIGASPLQVATMFTRAA
jgi:hypothetical protein